MIKTKNKKLKIKKLAALVLGIMMLLCFCGCETYDAFKAAFIDPPVVDETPVVKIGVLEPLTGSDADDAAEEVAGIKFANEFLPNFGNARVELVYGDNQSDVSVCPVVAQSLIDQGVSFIIGSSKSVLTLASSDVIASAGIPSIAVTNMNPIITATNPYYFRVCYIDSYEGMGASEFVASGLNTWHCAVAYVEGNDYASAMASEFISKYQEKLLALYEEDPEWFIAESEEPEVFEEVEEPAEEPKDQEVLEDAEEAPAEEVFDPNTFEVETVVLPAEAADYRLYFEALERKGIDTIYFPSTITQATTIINQIKDYGFNFNWVGTSTWNGLDVDDVYYTMDFDPKADLSEVAKNFKRAYEKQFGEGAKASEAFALSFDAYLLIREAVNVAGPTASRRQYLEALSNIEGLSGATGEITMGAGGDPIKDILVEHYKDGDFEVVYTVKGHETIRQLGSAKSETK